MTSENPATTPTVDPLDNPEVNQAALQFQNSIKTIKQRTSTLSKKSMERVFDAVLEFPLAHTEPKFRNKVEHELFVLALSALASKNTMMSAIMKDAENNQTLLEEAEKAMGEVP